ncbi:MAG TPA: CPBP family glutamic-type intramembrane protease [Ignavibacteria bacterium]|nr:CPBP family glutamic-type intramembrane protease [Ignavibacteria bacterium]HMR41931.1 CPBP family glutamic-type intramembrane protease [Ignavibacteria bacterium]
MIEYLKSELRSLNEEIRKLDFKVVYIFLSIAIITFLSLSFSSPTFYYENFGRNRYDSRIYWFLMDGILMFVIPALSVKFIFKQKLSEFGFTLGDKKFGFITSGLFFIVMLVVVWIVSGSEKFASTYPQGGIKVSESLSTFFLFEFSILVYMLGWEFFWRGYSLFGLKPKFGYYSVFIQMIPFFILHKGKPEIELFASIFAGLILGVQALRSRSFIYCWILHFLVMFSIDGISILRSQKEIYGIGITDLFNLFF